MSSEAASDAPLLGGATMTIRSTTERHGASKLKSCLTTSPPRLCDANESFRGVGMWSSKPATVAACS
jgi:hypothetical protein